ncbi:MAG: EamA family transporter RarD [Paracoccaceae bacterium]
MTEAARGVAAMVLCCCIWGLSALYYKLLDHVPPLELLAHRTLWSLLFFGAVLAVQRRLGQLRRAVTERATAFRVLLAGLTIATNWFFFIFSIQIGRATEASLGYYIFPLVAVLLGWLVLSERLTRAQWLAVGLAAGAVVLLTAGQGVAPWISLALPGSFGAYGLIKQRLDMGPVLSVAGEVLLLAPIALAILWLAHREGGVFGTSLADSLLLMLAGPLTGTPLILFAYAARRITLATVGLVQYLNPTLQFLVAVLIFAEPFGPWHAIAFPVIWTALAIYSLSSLRRERASRRAPVSSSVEAMLVTKPRNEASAKP